MNFASLSTTQIIIIVAVAAVVVLALIGTLRSIRRSHTQKLRTRFGATEYTRAVTEGGSQQKAEADLSARATRVEKLHIHPLGAGDRARFIDSWAKVQARFVDGPGSAVTDADQLLTDVMSTRGYPISDFEQRAADISVDHPLVLEKHRAAHQCALRQTDGKANTEELRQAMIHYRTLFEDLVNEPEIARAQSA